MRNPIYFILSGILILASCQSESTDSGADTTLVSEKPEANKSKTLLVPWSVVSNPETQALEIRKNGEADMINLTPQDIADAINLKYPQIRLNLEKVENSKAYLSIKDASYLTQRSGSEGAQAYLAEVTYSFTEFDEIGAVVFSFEEGDHAAPGTYSRESFKF